MTRMKTYLTVCLLGLVIAAPIRSSYTPQEKKADKPAGSELAAKIRRFAPTEITADASRLAKNDRQALDKIIEAARLMDPIFLRQVWNGNVALLKKLEADQSAEGRERLHYFKINVGPWSRLDENVAFIEGVPPVKVPHGSFYPDDMTKDEFNAWVKGLSEDERRRAEGFFYVIRREGKIF
jgi:hypothetical protein